MWISIVANWFSSVNAARNVVDSGQWRQVVSPVIPWNKPTIFLAVSALHVSNPSTARSLTWAKAKCLCASSISLLSFILSGWECHESRTLFLSIWCLSWPQAWANVSGPSVIGTLGPKWQRATCLPAHFLSSAHTLGLANAMPAHTLVQYDAHKHIQRQKNAAGDAQCTLKHWNLHSHAISREVSMTELPAHSVLLYAHSQMHCISRRKQHE